MRLSVALPTRNGGDLLPYSVASILAQDCDELELVVSDNASDDSTQDVLAEFAADPRMTVVRQDEPVDVTTNWNRVLSRCSGDYFLMLGDDDFMPAGSAERLLAHLSAYGDPDCLTFNGWAYAFPGALPEAPESHFSDPFYEWDPLLPAEGRIPMEAWRDVVRDFFRFRYRVHLNLQTTLIARRAVSRLSQGAFKPPFPDFYALNALMLRAETWAYVPEKLVIVGISPKSFGHTVHGHDTRAGVSYLGMADSSFPGHLPGNEIANGTYACLLHLKADYPVDLADVEISRPQYVFDQVYSWFLQARLGVLPRRAALRRLRLLRPRDWLDLWRGFFMNVSLDRLRRNVLLDRRKPARHLWPTLRPVPEVRSIAEFADWLERDRTAAT